MNWNVKEVQQKHDFLLNRYEMGVKYVPMCKVREEERQDWFHGSEIAKQRS